MGLLARILAWAVTLATTVMASSMIYTFSLWPVHDTAAFFMTERDWFVRAVDDAIMHSVGAFILGALLLVINRVLLVRISKQPKSRLPLWLSAVAVLVMAASAVCGAVAEYHTKPYM